MKSCQLPPTTSMGSAFYRVAFFVVLGLSGEMVADPFIPRPAAYNGDLESDGFPPRPILGRRRRAFLDSQIRHGRKNKNIKERLMERELHGREREREREEQEL